MSGFYGTPEMVAAQKRADARAALIADTPGLGFSGRVMVCDDLDVLGFEAARHYLKQDGQFAFRHVDVETADRIRSELEPDGITVHAWDVFTGETAPIRDAVGPRLATLTSDEFRFAKTSDAALGRMQEFLVAQGVAPISVGSLRGDYFPSVTRIMTNLSDEIVAVGWAALVHNRSSPRPKDAVLGMLAVSPAARGKGLGTRICAQTAAAALTDLGASYVMGFASKDNAPSQAMLTRCGLTLSPYLMLVASVSGEKLTR